MELIRGLSREQCTKLLYDWPFWAREEQCEPPGDWSIWLYLGGRGAGKTRSGAEWVRAQIEAGCGRVALVGATAADTRDVLVEGESGIISTAPSWSRPHYEPSKRRLTWPNGAMATTYSADEPERLRGPQHDAAWCDELGSWRYPAAWDMLMFGLRLGQRPRVMVTTTPRPIGLIRGLVQREVSLTNPNGDVAITRGSSYRNRANLAPTFFEQIVRKYEGTRLGRQELEAELLEDTPGALWSLGIIDAAREHNIPELSRVVVAIDPAMTSGEDADETGIIVAGRDARNPSHAWVLADVSGRYQPLEWAKTAIKAYHTFKADRIIAEVNNGGEMVGQTLRTVNPEIPFRPVHASRGKVIRAEPVAALYEQGRVHHVGSFARLEDQMCFPAGTLIETHRGQIPIEAVLAGDFARTRSGYFRIKTARETGLSTEFVIIEATNGGELRCTTAHPIFDKKSSKFVPARNVAAGMVLSVSPNWGNMAGRWRGADDGIIGCAPDTFVMRKALSCIERYGKRITARFLMDCTSIISMKIQEIIRSKICWFARPKSMWRSTSLAASSILTWQLEASIVRRLGLAERGMVFNAYFVASPGKHHIPTKPNFAVGFAGIGGVHNNELQEELAIDAARTSPQEIHEESIVVRNVIMRHTIPESVYNLEIDGPPEYYANGALVHNCQFTSDFDKKTAGYSPDRVDALVWAAIDLLPELTAPDDMAMWAALGR
jgi:phage terminase large subunit-like protein